MSRTVCTLLTLILSLPTLLSIANVVLWSHTNFELPNNSKKSSQIKLEYFDHLCLVKA